MSTTAPRGGGTSTAAVVDALYDAFLRGDASGMLALFSEDISLRFLGQAELSGRAAAKHFFAFAAGLLTDVEFVVDYKVIDGEWAAVIWHETARTSAGEPWANNGIDIMHVENGLVTALHENNDTRLIARHFPSYQPSGFLLNRTITCQ